MSTETSSVGSSAIYGWNQEASREVVKSGESKYDTKDLETVRSFVNGPLYDLEIMKGSHPWLGLPHHFSLGGTVQFKEWTTQHAAEHLGRDTEPFEEEKADHSHRCRPCTGEADGRYFQVSVHQEGISFITQEVQST